MAKREIKKVIIINPSSEIKITKEGRVIMSLNISFETPRMPLSMAIMAGGLENLCEVKIIDAVNEEIKREELKRQVHQFKPDLTIVNCSTPTIEDDMNAVIDAHETGSLTAMFGQHVDAIADETMNECGELDFCFRHEPELVASKFIQAWNSEGRLEDIKGLAFRDSSGKPVVNEIHPYVDLEELPRPARHLLKNDLYRLPDGELYTNLLASRGCPFNCPFCIAPAYHGLKVRRRDPKSLVDEVKSVYNEFGIKAFLFQSDLFTSSREWVKEVCEGLLETKIKGLRWICNSRVDTVDEETLKLMKKAGCFLMGIGIESGSPKLLPSLGKKVTVDKIKWMINACRKIGIRTNGSFVVGFPGETEETLKETEELVMQLPLDFAVFMCATPFPGTVFYEQLHEPDSRFRLNREWKKFCYHDYTILGGLPEKTIKDFNRKMLRKYFFSFHYLILRLRDLRHPISLLKTIFYALKRLKKLEISR
ncbi:MAG: radical SAM protein [Candidatus Coatesbacteria bacterium]|nr:radical SAM protein [Candidatus Coatesbacteria bacterium]